MRSFFGAKRKSKPAESQSMSLLPSPRVSLPPSMTIPNSLSPLPLKKIVVSVGKEGIVIQSAAKGSNDAVMCKWTDKGEDAVVERWQSKEEPQESCDCDGIIGLLKLFNDTYLLCISVSHTVATLPSPTSPTTDHPTAYKVRVIDHILALPLNQSRAAPALRKHLDRISQIRSSSPSSEDLVSVDRIPIDERDPDISPIEIGIDEIDSEDTDGGSVEETVDSDGNNNLKRPTELSRLLWRSNSSRSMRKGTMRLGSLPLPPSETVAVAESKEVNQGTAEVTESNALGSSFLKGDSTHSLPTPTPVIDVTEPIPTPSVTSTIPKIEKPTQRTLSTSQLELDKKILGETIRDFRGMYFSSDFDITNSLQRRFGNVATPCVEKEKNAEKMVKEGKNEGVIATMTKTTENPLLPLWRRSDRRFFWNLHLAKPFIRGGFHAYIYPIQQGFVTSSTFKIQNHSTFDIQLVLISRRSAERAGLRYLRRGVNEDGEVANFVETEMVLIAEREGKKHFTSFVQTRGSIPVYWSQSPWSLKPIPVIERTESDRLTAMKAHFESQTSLYGRQIIINLAEQHGKEGLIVSEYGDRVKELGRDDVKYVAWDFHENTKGMKYEKIGLLGDEVSKDLQDIGSFWFCDGQVLARQKGVFRTNCMDCLDRTNVVQSALSRWMLNIELQRLGVSLEETCLKFDNLDKILNGMWADNGDAISRHYAGTSALKGDFTRTGKRNWRGMVNDATNSVARMFQNTVADFFKQSVMDYFLGVNLSPTNFYSLASLGSDPGELIRLSNIRKVAIDTVTRECLEAEETKIGGWTFLSPAEKDNVRSDHYEERVLVMTEKALYIASYEYTLQKVREFVRIPLVDITKIQIGVYILSSLEECARNSEENFGFLIFYSPHDSFSRSRTYTLRNKSLSLSSISLPDDTPDQVSKQSTVDHPTVEHYFAFKAMRRDLIQIPNKGSFFLNAKGASFDRSIDNSSKTARESVIELVEQIKAECQNVGGVKEESDFVTEKDIISLGDAEKATSLMTRITYNLKSYIWL